MKDVFLDGPLAILIVKKLGTRLKAKIIAMNNGHLIRCSRTLVWTHSLQRSQKVLEIM